MKKVIYTSEQQSAWDTFVAANAADGGLCQSWLWGEIQERQGHEVIRIGIEHEGALVAVSQSIIMPLPLGQRYSYVPRGPVLARASDLVLFPQLQIGAPVIDQVMRAWRELSLERQALCVRVDPAWHDDVESAQLLARRGWRRYGQVQPRETLVIDLTQTDDQLLGAMKPKARYNMSVARKHGVEIVTGQDYLADALELLKLTGERAGITLHSDRHYQSLIETLHEHNAGELLVARHGARSIAAVVIAYFGDRAYYLHGGSDHAARALMAPHLIQLTAMRRARERGCHWYDLWGIDEQKWPGVTRFKRSLAPQVASTKYLGSFDVVERPLGYALYRAGRLFIRRT